MPLDFPEGEGLRRRPPMRIRLEAQIPPSDQALNPYTVPVPAPGVLPAGKVRSGAVIGMDWSPDVNQVFGWAVQGAFQEGIGFVGYPYLAQLTQRAEYRRISETIAKEMTRKWVKVTAKGDGKSAKVGRMNDALEKFNVREVFREAIEVDGFFGRAQIFIDHGDGMEDAAELAQALPVDKRKIDRGSLNGFRVVEPLWTYPGTYNSNNPLDPDFYKPRDWFVQGQRVHRTRLLTLVMRELPDILKPAYQFGGLSMSQMAKPYVDNWLRTRQSVSDLLHSFSVMILNTNLGDVMGGGAADDMVRRAQMFIQSRDNRGLMMVDKETEELSNIAVPLGTLDALQAQSQEQMASVAGVPLVILLGITPSGLNASSDGEIRTFYDNMAASQERFIRPPLKTVFDIIQLSEFGRIDPDLSFEFLPLWEADESEIAANRKMQADTDQVYVTMGAVDPMEIRERLAGEEESPYHGLDLSKDITPPALELAAMGAGPDDETDPDDEPPDAEA